MSSTSLIGLGMALSGATQGIQNGVAAGNAQYQAEQDRKAKREEAVTRKKITDLQLAKLGREDAIATGTHDEQLAATKAKLQETELKSKQLSMKMLRSDSFQALNNFFDSGDPKSINRFFKDNPEAGPLFDNTLRIEKLNLQSEEDRQLLRGMGVSDKELDGLDGKSDGTIDWEKLSRRYVKTVHTDGTISASDMLNKAATMGYADYADSKTLERMKKLAEIRKLNRDANGVAAQHKPTSFETKVASEASYQDAIAANKTPSSRDVAAHTLFTSETAGDKSVRRNNAEQAISQWSEQGFNKLSQDEILHGKRAPEARKLLRTMETEYGMTEADKKLITELSKVTALSPTAATLSEAETGVIDKAVSSMSSYINDDTKSKMGKMAYGALMNSVRHSLFGSAQTDGELKLFKQAYGTLGNQAGTAIAGLSQALQQVKAQITAVADRYPEPIIQGRLGKSRANITSAVKSLDQRIEFYNLVAEGITPDDAHQQVFGRQGASMTKEDITAALGL